MILRFFEKVTDGVFYLIQKVLSKMEMVGDKVFKMLTFSTKKSENVENRQQFDYEAKVEVNDHVLDSLQYMHTKIEESKTDDLVNSFKIYQGMEVTLLKLELATYYPSDIERVFCHMESEEIFVVETSYDKDGETFIYLGEL